ncbi:hypothetical protein JDV02_002894 [Purpureocillium takamizusanense]|uniref:ATP-grasp domain-containing protein n=1 Tax=Purpureocillium takamizusanense TaxID=2060973 RepID=A0A9Q8QCV7_9HYPO|nr:uncharacterized protein JDV02_002894 [Purpureocillium takamizusanense]UNI16462.1 hypothetical protein JDV02_002894 [Purpureocillium takamizusanense]
MGGYTVHFLKNLLLLCLSLAILPLSTIVIAVLSILEIAGSSARRHGRADNARQRTILVNGMGMAKGLTIARLLHSQGHRVIGADCKRLSPGRVSKALDAFYVLPRPSQAHVTRHPSEKDVPEDPYLKRLAQIVQQEGVNLWISVSDVVAALHDARAKEYIERNTEAKAVQLCIEDIAVLDSKTRFIELSRSLGLLAPDTQTVTDKTTLVDFLSARGGLSLRPGDAQYVVKPEGVNDLARFEKPILPLRTAEETISRIDSIPFGPGVEFIVQEFIQGDEYCTHALVVRGSVRAFVACPSSDLLMHYVALPSPVKSELSRKMLHFTETIVASGGDTWTGHVSFDFLVKRGGNDTKQGHDIDIYPIECNPRVHTAVVLLGGLPEMADEYLAVLDHTRPLRLEPLYAQSQDKYYWIGQDLVEHVAIPAWHAARGVLSLVTFWQVLQAFIHRACTWKDGTFEAWDPWPWWWLYHVYWPMQFVKHMARGRWSKINVSTGKIFEAGY